ncbi:GATA zinc finger domain-containing protein 15-like isoform X2 [Daktulosphaira vitifoliae]|uniref:GATA zinc finger domain-containing protein 15-like isoform X2 n=1 Tax=Daktulosphaira vitifoliae TaxID=58002 RepID=UPI0021AA8E6C|nr:GATA zinc finger domain-containing protein 15-like isoform X2 [Daktulosphaira vitifoliae]
MTLFRTHDAADYIPMFSSTIDDTSNDKFSICIRIIENMEYIYEQVTGHALISVLCLRNITPPDIHKIPIHILFSDHKLLAVYRRGWYESIDYKNINLGMILNKNPIGPKLDIKLKNLAPDKILSVVQYCKRTITSISYIYQKITGFSILSPKMCHWMDQNFSNIKIQDLLSDDLLAAVYSRGWSDQESSIVNMINFSNIDGRSTSLNSNNINNKTIIINQIIQNTVQISTTNELTEKMASRKKIEISNKNNVAAISEKKLSTNLKKNDKNHDNVKIIAQKYNDNKIMFEKNNKKIEHFHKIEKLEAPESNNIADSNLGCKNESIRRYQPFPSMTKNYYNSNIISETNNLMEKQTPIKNLCFINEKNPNMCSKNYFNETLKLKRKCKDIKTTLQSHKQIYNFHDAHINGSNVEKKNLNTCNVSSNSLANDTKDSENYESVVDDILNYINREILKQGNCIINNSNTEKNLIKKKKRRRQKKNIKNK